MKKLLAGILPYALVVILAVAAILAAWNFLSGIGYKAVAIAAERDRDRVQAKLTACMDQSASRLAQIERQNAAVDQAKADAEARTRAALAARDEAVALQADTQARYERIRRNWPDDALSAVELVRQEYGL
tara:strand:+ start:27494 stop:27883 length:390 start_codon:yes stop_codon:yes gene_type:complete